MITVASINKDIEDIRSMLANSDCSVPNCWDVFRPGLILIILNVFLQVMLVVDEIIIEGLSVHSLFPIAFTLFFSFIVAISITQLRSLFLSLPVEIREKSLIVKLIKDKVNRYMMIVICSVIVAWLVILLFEFPPFSYYVFQFLLLLFFSFVFSADMSRYKLTALRAIIISWRGSHEIL